MLFRPVSGPEIEVIYTLIAQSPEPLSRQALYQACFPTYLDGRAVSSQSVDDALAFLVSAFLIEEKSGFKLIQPKKTRAPFRLALISQLQKLASGAVEPVNKIDALYFVLLDQLFVKPDQLYISDVHAEANKLRLVVEMGGISQEKIRSWKRVMAFLGVGQRIAQGFQCVYTPKLLQQILSVWSVREGFIQEFLEEHFVHYLPFQTQAGDLAQAVCHSLDYLKQQQIVQMRAYQDSSSKPYFGERRWRYITYRKGDL